MQQTASAPAELREKAEWPAEVAAQVRELRRERGESGEEFGAVIGLSKGKVSELECGKFRPNVACALLIEALSMQDGTPRIDAADLNDDVRASRQGVTGGGGAVHDQGVTPATPAPATGQIGDLSGRRAAQDAA